jgi:hypothetical protein
MDSVGKWWMGVGFGSKNDIFFRGINMVSPNDLFCLPFNYISRSGILYPHPPEFAGEPTSEGYLHGEDEFGRSLLELQ